MPVRFRDRRGSRGTISDGLDVEYAGRWQADIERLVADMVAEIGDADQPFDGFDPDSHLLLELPLVAPIVEVQRVLEPTD